MKTSIKVFIIFMSIILGGFLGELALSIPELRFLSAGKTFGITSPMVLELGIIKLTIGIVIRLNVAAAIGVIVSLIVIKKVSR